MVMVVLAHPLQNSNPTNSEATPHFFEVQAQKVCSVEHGNDLLGQPSRLAD